MLSWKVFKLKLATEMKSLCQCYNKSNEHSLDYLGFAIAVYLYWFPARPHRKLFYFQRELNFPRLQPTRGFAN